MRYIRYLKSAPCSGIMTGIICIKTRQVCCSSRDRSAECVAGREMLLSAAAAGGGGWAGYC